MVSGFLGNSATNNGDLKIKMNTRSAVETESSPPVSTAPLAEPAEVDAGAVSVEDDSVSDWQKQKQAMMAMYGGESEPTEPEVTTPAEMNASQPQADALDSGDSGTAASEPPVSTEETTVDVLKAELNSKIREAEVEMSINRARLMQELGSMDLGGAFSFAQHNVTIVSSGSVCKKTYCAVPARFS